MRKGFNPGKDVSLNNELYNHQVIIPLFIPDNQGYFRDSYRIFESCIKSLSNSISSKTFVTVVNNGSSNDVRLLLNKLLGEGIIQEVIHTENIGKLNAIIKGIVGHNIPLITIADSDVFFCKGWQEATIEVFNNFPKAGIVGIVPQFNMFSNNCTNVLFENLFNQKCKFYPVEEPNDMRRFYQSLGWNMPEGHYYIQSILGIEKNGKKVCIGSGHFVATYRKELFTDPKKYFSYKLGGDSERYLDRAAIVKGYWKLTTFKNYAYHMGNTWESWMENFNSSKKSDSLTIQDLNNLSQKRPISLISFLIKNKLFKKILQVPMINKKFLKYKGLSGYELSKYKRISY